MNVHYHPGKANVVIDALSMMIMGSTAHIEEENKELAKEVHRLARLGVQLVDSTSGSVSVHPSNESSFVVEVKKDQYLDLVFMELKDSVLININKSFTLGDDGIHMYQDRLCVPDEDHLRTKIIVEAHGIPYIQVQLKCIMILSRFIGGMA